MRGKTRGRVHRDRAVPPRGAAARTAELLKAVPDARAIVPGLTWTAAEAGAHLVIALKSYRELLLGTPGAKATLSLAPDEQTPTQHSAVHNAAQLAQFSERDPLRLADLLVPSVDAFLAAAVARQDGERILTGTGISMTVPTMTAALLGEQLIHGLDIARAAKMSWPISGTDALVVLTGVMVMLPDYLDRERTAGLHVAYELGFRGGSRYRLQVDDGTATVTAAGRPVDCWISADPTTFLLLGYRRSSRRSQLVRGRIVAGPDTPASRRHFLEPDYGATCFLTGSAKPRKPEGGGRGRESGRAAGGPADGQCRRAGHFLPRQPGRRARSHFPAWELVLGADLAARA